MVLKALNCYAESPGALPDGLEAGTRTIGPVSLAEQRDPPSSLPHPLSSTVVGQGSQGVIFIRERIIDLSRETWDKDLMKKEAEL